MTIHEEFASVIWGGLQHVQTVWVDEDGGVHLVERKDCVRVDRPNTTASEVELKPKKKKDNGIR